jgi:YceI-like domain
MFRTATSQASTPRVIAIRIWICFGKIFAPRKSSWDFTIRGVSNLEKLMLTISGEGTGSGELHGAMVFNRKNYGMDKGIPFIKVADHVDVNFHLKWKHVGGPPLA